MNEGICDFRFAICDLRAWGSAKKLTKSVEPRITKITRIFLSYPRKSAQSAVKNFKSQIANLKLQIPCAT
jgi:hypothetical protein